MKTMTKEENRLVLQRCVQFLRDTADSLECGHGGEDPVGVLMMTETGPKVYVPAEYAAATAEAIQKHDISIHPYSKKRVS